MRFSELEGRRIAVWGAGLETRSFGRQLAAHLPGARIEWLIVEDSAPELPVAASEPELLAGAGAGARVVRASEVAELADQIEVLVRSPGVSLHRPEVAALREAGVVTATPTALWLAERGGRNVIGITATKGKSTTAALTAHLARASGAIVHLAGNIGEPALNLLGSPDEELVVLELSSYQTADLTTGPQTAVASNLYREHLNWHLTEEAYAREKLRLLGLPGVEHCVVGALSEPVMAAPTAPGAQVLTFGVAPGWCVTSGGVEQDGALAVPTAALRCPARTTRSISARRWRPWKRMACPAPSCRRRSPVLRPSRTALSSCTNRMGCATSTTRSRPPPNPPSSRSTASPAPTSCCLAAAWIAVRTTRPWRHGLPSVARP